MSYIKRVLEYVNDGMSEADAYALVAAERRAVDVAEREARRPLITSPDDAHECTADCCADDSEESEGAATAGTSPETLSRQRAS